MTKRIREFAEILLRRRGTLGTAGTPLIEETLLAASASTFTKRHPNRCRGWRKSSILGRRGGHTCSRIALRRNWCGSSATSDHSRPRHAGPKPPRPERILRSVLQSPAFRVRSGDATFDVGRLLNERGILILDGGSRGNLSRDAMFPS